MELTMKDISICCALIGLLLKFLADRMRGE
jgi:hypothetical protein